MTRENEINELRRRIAELERVVSQLGPPHLYDGGWLKPQPCLFDGINPEQNPVMGLACSCPRCSPR